MGKGEVLKGVLLVGLGASIYGMLATVVKLAYQSDYTTAEVTTSQFTLGLLGLIILNLIQSKSSKVALSKPSKKDILQLFLAGTSYGLTSIFYYLSVQFINVSVAIVLLMQSVWIGVVVESVMNKEFPSRRKIISAVIVLIGTLFATNVVQSDVNLDWRGFLFGFLAAMSFSTTMFASNRIANHLPALRKSLIMLCGGAIMVFLFLLFTQVGPYYFSNIFQGISFSFVEVRAFDFSIFWKYGLFLAIFGTILPPILLNLGFPKTGLGLGSIVSSLELPVSVMMAYILLKEQVLWIQWLGILFILMAIVYMNWNSIVKSKE